MPGNGQDRDGPAGQPSARFDRCLDFVLMRICIGLFVLSWVVLDRYSMIAAVVVFVVALASVGSYNRVMADDASAQARGGEMVPREDQRVTHEDRDRAVDVLKLAAGVGRLTLEELDERVGAALTARTYGELTALVSDLPTARDTPAAPPGAPEPKDLVRIECHHSFARRDGQWLVPRRMQLGINYGRVTLDFTQAILSWPVLRIDVEVHNPGSLTLVTRPGIMVDTDDLEIRGGTVKVLAPWDRDVPVRFRIDVAGTVDYNGSIEASPPGQTLWQRLLGRRPVLQPLPPGHA